MLTAARLHVGLCLASLAQNNVRKRDETDHLLFYELGSVFPECQVTKGACPKDLVVEMRGWIMYENQNKELVFAQSCLTVSISFRGVKRTCYTSYSHHCSYILLIITIINKGPQCIYDPLSTVSVLSGTAENPPCPSSSFLLSGGYKCSLSWAPTPFH